MNLKELPVDAIEAVLDSLPADISFVDSEYRVKYFNTPSKGRLFQRLLDDDGGGK